MSNTIQVLEFIKYLTVKRQVDNVKRKVAFSGSGEMAIYISGSSGNTNLSMPEGFTIDFRLINVHWGALFLDVWNDDESSDNFLFEFSNGSNGHIKENFYRDLTFNNESYRMYVFYSDYYKELSQTNPNQVMTLINEVDNANFRDLNEERYFPFSMVITIKNESQNIQNFEKFMNMDYADWGLSFNFHRIRFLQYNDLTLFEKYDVKIIVDYLENVKLIEILKNICDGWTNGIIAQDVRRDLLLSILSEIKTENAKDIYEEFFMTPSPLFYNSIINNLDNFLDPDAGKYKVQFIFLLMKLFYKKMSTEDLIAYENKIINLPREKILPFLVNEQPANIQRGPYYNFDITMTGLLIENMTFKVYKPLTENDVIPQNRPIDPNNPNENLFPYINNLQFGFDEIIGALACFDKPDQGFNQLMVYPIPAFAFPVFHENLSEKYKLRDLLVELNTAACIIFPFFRIVQLQALESNIVALLFGIGGSILKPPIKAKIQGTPNGKNFMYLYDIFSNFWVAKDLTIAVIIERGGLKAFADCENLLAAWSLYDNAEGYGALFNEYPVEAGEIKDNITELNKEYEKAKKKK